jgi:predicted nuclease of predicted toxin-antitoxin system
MRLYANENFPLQAVEELRRLGHDVQTTQESGLAGRAVPDHEVLAFAIADRRVLLALNRRHFIRLHKENSDHHGIVVCTFDLDFAGLSRRIHTALAAHAKVQGQLVRVNRPG